MNLKLNGNGNGQPKPYLKIALLAFAVLLVGLLLHRQVDRLAGPKRTVWVTKSDLGQGAVLGSNDLEEKAVREAKVPKGALRNARAAVGRTLARAKAAGAPLVGADLAAASGGPGSIAELVPEGRVLMTLRVNDRALPFPELRRGDRLDLLAAGGRRSGPVASDAYFLGWIQPEAETSQEESNSIFGIDLSPPGREPTDGDISLLLALRPEDVFRLAQAEASRAPISVVLHGQSEVEDGRLLDLTGPRAAKVELIAGANRQSVALKP